jgi:hypothetical protein
MQVAPDYRDQLERLIQVLQHREGVPAWIVSLIGASVGSLLTICVELLKRALEAQGKRNAMLTSIYKELAGNFQNLIACLHTMKLNKSQTVQINLHDVPVNRAKLDTARAELAYDQIKNSAAIERAYAGFNRLHGLANAPEHIEVAEGIAFQIEQDLFTGDLDLKRFASFSDKRLANRLRKKETTAEFWRVSAMTGGTS